MAVFITSSPEETRALGKRLAGLLRPGCLLAFTGGLGVGKTTFTAGLAEGLGCKDAVSSPTYAIVNLYRGDVPLAHFDLYRIGSADDLEAAGFYDYLDEGAVVAVEWSERLPLPEPPDVRVDLLADGALRRITIEGVEGL